MSPVLIAGVWVAGAATSIATTSYATILAQQGSGFDPLVGALYALGLLIALGVIGLIRATWQAVIKPLQEQFPIIANAAVMKWINEKRSKQGLPPVVLDVKSFPVPDEDSSDDDGERPPVEGSE